MPLIRSEALANPGWPIYKRLDTHAQRCTMSEQTRWSLKVSRQTDIALRSLLASRGGRKGDLSRFVEEAVNREVLRQTIRDIHEQNAHLDADELQKLIDEEVTEARRARRAGRR